MEPVTRVVLALDAPEVLEELLHFLDRSGAAQVLATVSDAQQVEPAIRHLEPDLVLAEPRLAPLVAPGTPCIAIASRESIAALRAAIAAGVRAFTVWPIERDELLVQVRAFAPTRRALERRARVIAVHATRWSRMHLHRNTSAQALAQGPHLRPVGHGPVGRRRLGAGIPEGRTTSTPSMRSPASWRR
jgi:DNA-binding NarL/FixJ family response regulator